MCPKEVVSKFGNPADKAVAEGGGMDQLGKAMADEAVEKLYDGLIDHEQTLGILTSQECGMDREDAEVLDESGVRARNGEERRFLREEIIKLKDSAPKDEQGGKDRRMLEDRLDLVEKVMKDLGEK